MRSQGRLGTRRRQEGSGTHQSQRQHIKTENQGFCLRVSRLVAPLTQEVRQPLVQVPTGPGLQVQTPTSGPTHAEDVH